MHLTLDMTVYLFHLKERSALGVEGCPVCEIGMALLWRWFSQETCLLGRGAWHLNVEIWSLGGLGGSKLT